MSSKSKSKGEGRPKTGLEGTNEEQIYSSTLPSSLVLEVGG